MQEVTDQFSVEATWMARWKKTEIDPRGTYFSTNDFVGDGRHHRLHRLRPPQRLARPRGHLPGQPDRPAGRAAFGRHDPGNGGEYGIALRYLLPEHNNTELGLYFVNYHSRTPYVSGYRGGITAAQTISNNLTPQPGRGAGGGGHSGGGHGQSGVHRRSTSPPSAPLYNATNIGKLAPIVGGVANATGLAALNATNAACATAAGRRRHLLRRLPREHQALGR